MSLDLLLILFSNYQAHHVIPPNVEFNFVINQSINRIF